MRRLAHLLLTCATLAAISACSTDLAPSRESQEKTLTCPNGRYAWDIKNKWELTVLDKPQKVTAGKKFTAKSTIFNPRSAKISQTDGTVDPADAMKNLERTLKLELASPGRNTESERRVMSASFEAPAQAVYYRGVKAITASYSYTCASGKPLRRGEIYTWDLKSPTTGLADCLAQPSENSNSELAKSAIRRQCPTGSPARAVLGE